jgi:hypothetical protein
LANLKVAGWRDRVLWAVVATSTLAHVVLALRYFGFLGGDDVEVLEEGFRRALGLTYHPWPGRNLLLSDAVVAPVLRLAAGCGITHPTALIFAGTLPFIVLASVNVVLVHALVRRWLDDLLAARIAALVYAFHWLPLAYGSTTYPRTATTTCVLLAALALSARGADSRRGAAAGLLAAIAFGFRYSEGVYLLPLLVFAVWSGSTRDARRSRVLGVCAGFAAGAALVGLVDALTWGRPFASLVVLAREMLTHAGTEAGGLAVRSPFFFLLRFLFWLPPVAVPALIVVRRERRLRAAWAFLLAPLLVFSLIAHKELRFLQGAIPFLAVLLGAGFSAMWRRGWRAATVILLATTVAAESLRVDILFGKSMAAVTAAREVAAGRSVRVVALEQAWAYGGMLYLGDRIEVRDLPVPPSPAQLERALDGADRVGLYRADVAKQPELAATLERRGFSRRRVVEWGESKAVVIFARP